MTYPSDRSLSLHPDHYQDLKRSGLTDETIVASGIYTVPPADIRKKLQKDFPNVESVMAIPYPGTQGFERFKLFPPPAPGKKYWQPPNSNNRLYLPAGVEQTIGDISVDLYIVEGEKKCLKANQEGVPCVGIGGLWNWSNGHGELIGDFDRIEMKGRRVVIVPDSDWNTDAPHYVSGNGRARNLRLAVERLAERLRDRGAKAFVVDLPAGPNGEKVGLDDFLISSSVAEFKSLPTIELKPFIFPQDIENASLNDLPSILEALRHVDGESIREAYIARLSKQLKTSKKAIRKDLMMEEKEAKPERSAITAYFPGLVDVCLDRDGEPCFLIEEEHSIDIAYEVVIDGKLFHPPDLDHLPFKPPRAEEVIRYYQAGPDPSLFPDLLNHLKGFSYLPEPMWRIVAGFVHLSYVQDHPDVQYFPILSFYASPERGKTRTGKIIINLSFRGVHIVTLREANLFRFSQDLRATLFFDTKDLWKKAEQNGCEDIILLRFERGAKVARVLYPEKGPFKDTIYYDIYGPTLMATNEPVHHILDTRCIPITMPNKPGDYKNVTLEEILPFKERLTAWRARALYEKFPDIDIPNFLSGRLRDITRPLMQVVKSLSLQDYPLLIEALREVADQRSEDKQGTLDGQIVAIIRDLSPDISEWTISTADILERINSSRPEKHKITSQFLGKRLNGMGLKTRLVKGKSELRLDRRKLEIYLEQYGSSNLCSPPSDGIRQNSTNFIPSMNSYGCDDGIKGVISTSFDQSPQESTSKKELNFQRDNQEQELGRVSKGPSPQENVQVVFNLENDEVEITA